MNLWPLIGVALVVLGFALRLNPAMVVVAAGIVTGLVAGKTPFAVLELLGEAFVKNRFLALFLLALPVIGLLERHGLREHAQAWVARLHGATTGRLLIAYLVLRQFAASVGLTSLGGHPQMVRPLVAPMAEGAAQARIVALHAERLAEMRAETEAVGSGETAVEVAARAAVRADRTEAPVPEIAPELPLASTEHIRAFAAATDNVGLFFGEDVFIAFGAVLLMQAFYAEHGIVLEPLQIALWGIPTAICAFIIHATRLYRFDLQLEREARVLARGETPP
jgi:uncharacterized membrane protein